MHHEDENGENEAFVRMVRQRPLLECVKNGNGEKEGFVYLTQVVESS